MKRNVLAGVMVGLCVQASVSWAALYSNGVMLSGASITIDGNMSDWDTSGIYSVADGDETSYWRDTVGDPYVDLTRVYMANDSQNLYIRFTTSQNRMSNYENFMLVMNTDGNASTGTNYDGPANFDLNGADVYAETLLGLDNPWNEHYTIKTADENNGWVDKTSTPTSGWYGVDNSTGVEFSIPLAWLAGTGNRTIEWVCSSNYGDTIMGYTWNQSLTANAYQVVVPEPISCMFLGLGSLLFCRKRK